MARIWATLSGVHDGAQAGGLDVEAHSSVLSATTAQALIVFGRDTAVEWVARVCSRLEALESTSGDIPGACEVDPDTGDLYILLSVKLDQTDANSFVSFYDAGDLEGDGAPVITFDRTKSGELGLPGLRTEGGILHEGRMGFVAKYSAAGKLLWAKRFGTYADGDCRKVVPRGIQIRADGTILVSTMSKGGSASNSNSSRTVYGPGEDDEQVYDSYTDNQEENHHFRLRQDNGRFVAGSLMVTRVQKTSPETTGDMVELSRTTRGPRGDTDWVSSWYSGTGDEAFRVSEGLASEEDIPGESTDENQPVLARFTIAGQLAWYRRTNISTGADHLVYTGTSVLAGWRKRISGDGPETLLLDDGTSKAPTSTQSILNVVRSDALPTCYNWNGSIRWTKRITDPTAGDTVNDIIYFEPQDADEDQGLALFRGVTRLADKQVNIAVGEDNAETLTPSAGEYLGWVQMMDLTTGTTLWALPWSTAALPADDPGARARILGDRVFVVVELSGNTTFDLGGANETAVTVSGRASHYLLEINALSGAFVSATEVGYNDSSFMRLRAFSAYGGELSGTVSASALNGEFDDRVDDLESQNASGAKPWFLPLDLYAQVADNTALVHRSMEFVLGDDVEVLSMMLHGFDPTSQTISAQLAARGQDPSEVSSSITDLTAYLPNTTVDASVTATNTVPGGAGSKDLTDKTADCAWLLAGVPYTITVSTDEPTHATADRIQVMLALSLRRRRA